MSPTTIDTIYKYPRCRMLAVMDRIGQPGGAYGTYAALVKATAQPPPDFVPDLTGTQPVFRPTPRASWSNGSIVTFDPRGFEVDSATKPTMAITRAQLNIPEMPSLRRDGTVVTEAGEIVVTKIAIDAVWDLPGLAKRLGVQESVLRQHLHEQCPHEGLLDPKRTHYYPPIGGLTAYVFGDPERLADPTSTVTVRPHDECNGSDVFGSDICTCRPYLMYAVQKCVETAQAGGVGLVVYFRKEGRALGEVTKYLVYNARQRQEGGDRSEAYFERTSVVAGVEDARFQSTMPDVLVWLGIQHITNLVSMSAEKHEAIRSAGIRVDTRVALPEALIPRGATVEIDAKVAAGYFGTSASVSTVPSSSKKS